MLQKNISFQENAWSQISKELTIEETLTDIRNGKYATKIAQLRQLLLEKKYEEYDYHKKALPAVTFCGAYSRNRRKECLKAYNHLLVIDVDNLSVDDLESCKIKLIKDDYVGALWESPSKNGLKALIPLVYAFDSSNTSFDSLHKAAFNKAFRYFSETNSIEIDKTGSDITRLCYLSYDPKILIKNQVKAFEILEEDLNDIKSLEVPLQEEQVNYISNDDRLQNPINKNKSENRRKMKGIIKYLKKRKLSITYNYVDWIRVAMGISNSFTYDIGKKYFLELSQLDPDKYDEDRCIGMLRECYEKTRGEIRFNTVVYLASTKGYLSGGL